MEGIDRKVAVCQANREASTKFCPTINGMCVEKCVLRSLRTRHTGYSSYVYCYCRLHQVNVSDYAGYEDLEDSEDA